MPNKDFFSVVENRRSIYGLSKDVEVAEERIEEIIEHAVTHAPSAFNSQSGRVVVLFGEQHDKLWNLTEDVLRTQVPEDKFQPTADKMQSFRNGFGTVLFFEDQAVIKSLQEQFALYKDAFPGYSLQSSGMLQYIIWTALSSEGIGASLQHYNPLIDESVQEAFNIPADWKLIAQMPFGNPTAEAGEKQINSLADRIKVIR